MTESEAHTKWCPFTRQRSHHGDGTALNRQSDGTLVGKCAGSMCMAWRRDQDRGADHGYCGLAGAPQP